MNEESLYEYVKNKICDRIFDGVYEEGNRIPSERVLAEELEVSRVTIRKSMEILEKENLVVREVGSGTRVVLPVCGAETALDMIVLIAPARNPFFSEFIARFQTYVQARDAMVLYVEKPKTESLENCLYRLYKKKLQNVVVWLEDLSVDRDKLKRLRALGMNMVFFDTDRGLPYADCVALDNQLAVQTLYKLLKKKCENVAYIGWDRMDIYSIAEREAVFLKQAGFGSHILRLPWADLEQCRYLIENMLTGSQKEAPDGVICGDQEILKAVFHVMSERKIEGLRLSSVDTYLEAERNHAVLYVQDLKASVKQIYECLSVQGQKKSLWRADMYRLKGTLKQ